MTNNFWTAIIDTTGNMHHADASVSMTDTISQLTDSAAWKISLMMPRTSGEVTPVIRHVYPDQWFLYVLLALLLIVSVIWHYIPERLVNIFSLSARRMIKRTSENAAPGPGIAVTVFFLLNTLITTSFFILYMIKYEWPGHYFTGLEDWLLLVYIAVGLTAFSSVKLILGRLLGFLFGTDAMAKKQQVIYFNSYNAMGVILLPLLFVLIIMGGKVWLYFILLIVAGMFIYRWTQTIVIGIHQTRFSTFHLILYLCTLEIIPLLVLWRVLM